MVTKEIEIEIINKLIQNLLEHSENKLELLNGNYS